LTPISAQSGPEVSVIVRTKDKADTVEATLRALDAQTVRPEIVVVDSGSTDGTLEIARRLADRLVELPAAEFTFGRALNLGADAASAPVHAALSAHCLPADDRWAERISECHRDPRVVGTNGVRRLADGRRASEIHLQDYAAARANPWWGFSNHASSWRADVWRADPFREDLVASEDREWALRVLSRGERFIAFDPHNYVAALHRRSAGVRALYERHRVEAEGMASFAGFPAWTPRSLLRDWWVDVPRDDRPKAWHRISPYRLIGLAGTHVGLRAASRH
jgi:rhamnosyltransferase